MMLLRGLVLLIMFSLADSRRSFRVGDFRHDEQQQNESLTKAFQVTAKAREALLPSSFGKALFSRRGLQADASPAAHRQASQLREPHGQPPSIRFRGLRAWGPSGPRRATVSLRDLDPDAESYDEHRAEQAAMGERTTTLRQPKQEKFRRHVRSPPLNMQQQDEIDLSQPTFDLLELRNFRRDAVLQYAVTQRSQQLRGLFFASSAVVGAIWPWFTQELLGSAGDIDALTLGVSAASSILFGTLAVREKQRRGKVLLRLDRELRIGDLSIWQPRSAVGGGQPRQLKDLRGKRRVVVLGGSPRALLDELGRAAVYKRRLEQSGVVLVCVPLDAAADTSSEVAASWAARASEAEAAGWVWQPTDIAQWREYFAELLSGRTTPADAAQSGAWFALSLRGRSCASGVGALVWDELLGTNLPPLRPLSAADPAVAAVNEEEAALLVAQQELYKALQAADAGVVAAQFVEQDDAEVSSLARGGRLDEWRTVLKYDATVGMALSSQDVSVGDGEAYTTGLEFPAGSGGNSLLCTQRWVRAAEGWRLAQHRTIPYTEDVDAAACLRCDHRGCVALQRAGPQGPSGMPGDGKA